MTGALRGMLLWAPPNRVADAVYAADGAAARFGRIDYVKDAMTRKGEWGSAALALNGFNDEDIFTLLDEVLPHNLADAIAFRAAGAAAMPGWAGRVTGPTDGLIWTLRPIDDRLAYVMEKLVNSYHYPETGAAGIVGNLYAESGVLPTRIEGSGEKTPMKAQDFGGKTKTFTPKEIMTRPAGTGPKLPGVGLAQWTSAARRSALFAIQGPSILFDMDAQVAFLVTELAANAGLNARLKATGVTVDKATDDIVYEFEVPGSVLDPDKKKLPRTDPAVQDTFKARRPLAHRALTAYGATLAAAPGAP
jgi:hypothetical protein